MLYEKSKFLQLNLHLQDSKEVNKPSEESYDLETESVVCESEILEIKLVEDTETIILRDQVRNVQLSKELMAGLQKECFLRVFSLLLEGR